MSKSAPATPSGNNKPACLNARLLRARDPVDQSFDSSLGQDSPHNVTPRRDGRLERYESDYGDAELESVSYFGEGMDPETVSLTSTRTCMPRFVRTLLEKVVPARAADCALTPLDVVAMMHVRWEHSHPSLASLDIENLDSSSWTTEMWWGQLHSA